MIQRMCGSRWQRISLEPKGVTSFDDFVEYKHIARNPGYLGA